jgi:DUF177 domain-containing protein
VKIDLTELLQKANKEIDIQESENISFPDDDLNLTKPVKVNLHLVNSGETVLLTGKATTETELECSRCLKKYKVPISISLNEEFTKNPFVPSGKGAIELKDEDFANPIDEDNLVDLTEILRQDLLLAIPIKTLCSKNCKGIGGK